MAAKKVEPLKKYPLDAIANKKAAKPSATAKKVAAAKAAATTN